MSITCKKNIRIASNLSAADNKIPSTASTMVSAAVSVVVSSGIGSATGSATGSTFDSLSKPRLDHNPPSGRTVFDNIGRFWSISTLGGFTYGALQIILY